MARHQFAVIALAAVALASSFWLLLDLFSGLYSQTTATFGVASFEDRFSEFRKTLAPHTVLGYLSDNPANDPSNPSEFNLTQYTLAPAIVRPFSDERLVVLNYHSATPDQAGFAARHLAPIHDFGKGVLLCRNDTR